MMYGMPNDIPWPVLTKHNDDNKSQPKYIILQTPILSYINNNNNILLQTRIIR